MLEIGAVFFVVIIVCMICFHIQYTSESNKEIIHLKQSVGNWRNLYYEEKNKKIHSLDKQPTETDKIYTLEKTIDKLRSALDEKNNTIKNLEKN